MSGQRFEPVSLDVMNARLCDRLDSLVTRLLPGARFEGGYWRCGSIGGEAGQSLAIWTKGAKRGEWCDYASKEGGDLVGLVHAALGHGRDKADWAKTFAWIRDFTGLGNGVSAEERRREETEASADKARRAAEARADAEKKRRRALAYFLEAVPIPGTLAERYLLGRNIRLNLLGKAPGALRFHPAMYDRQHDMRRPCLLAKLDGPDGQLVTVHRTFLHLHADGRVTKADRDPGRPMSDAKLAYSDYRGGWIPVWRGATGQPMRKMPADEWICITEGVEDALTIAMAAPDKRVIAALSLNNLDALQLPPRAGGLWLCADNDVKPAAIESFRRARARLEARGFTCREFRPPAGIKDFNEWAAVIAASADRQQLSRAGQ
jgi:hypothetical protein